MHALTAEHYVLAVRHRHPFADTDAAVMLEECVRFPLELIRVRVTKAVDHLVKSRKQAKRRARR